MKTMKTNAKHPGYIIMNTGAPISTQEIDVRRFHKETAKTRQSARIPRAVGAALDPHRAERDAAAYAEIWTERGSPLIHTCERVGDALRERIDAPLEVAMLHGEPSVERAVGRLLDQGADEIRVLPLYPQYAIETHGACVDKVDRELRARRSRVKPRAAPPFYDHEAFVTPLAKQLEGTEEHVLFSYRGITIHHLKISDGHGHCLSSMECCQEPSAAHDTCYRFQCLKTSRLIAKAAGLTEARYSVGFDTLPGPEKCLKPFTKDLLLHLPKSGHRRVVVLCPSHYCDGVETLEEVERRGRALFMEAGGESFRVIQSLNDSEDGLRCLERQILESDAWEFAREEDWRFARA